MNQNNSNAKQEIMFFQYTKFLLSQDLRQNNERQMFQIESVINHNVLILLQL